MIAYNEKIQTISVQAANPAGATVRNIPWFKAPRALTIKAAFATSESGLLTATPLTQALAMAILNGGTAGTGTATIATFGTSLSAFSWTARQGYSATLPADGSTTSLQDLAANQWLVAQHSEIGSSSAGVLTICVHHVEGTGRVT
jgi:hypothetical protein